MTKKPKDTHNADDIFRDLPTTNFDGFPTFDDFPKLDADFFKAPEMNFEPLDDSLFKDTPDFFDPSLTSTGEPLPPPDPSLTATDAAAWMKEEVERTDYLDQKRAAWHVRDHFGERFTIINRNGNPAIAPEVLEEFLKVTKETVVWSKRRRYWRKRKLGDAAGREVQY